SGEHSAIDTATAARQVCTPSSVGGMDMTTVLIVHAETSSRLLVSAAIDSEHYRVLEAADGDEAWRLLQEHRPTVVLLDVKLPGRDGLELTRAIKRDLDLQNAKVILLTARAQEADVRAGVEAGADLYLTKPFSPLELLTVVEE